MRSGQAWAAPLSRPLSRPLSWPLLGPLVMAAGLASAAEPWSTNPVSKKPCREFVAHVNAGIQAGEAEALLAAAQLFEHGVCVDVAPARAAELLQLAVDRGHPAARMHAWVRIGSPSQGASLHVTIKPAEPPETWLIEFPPETGSASAESLWARSQRRQFLRNALSEAARSLPPPDLARLDLKPVRLEWVFKYADADRDYDEVRDHLSRPPG